MAVVKKSVPTYPTAPLKCWGKAKELREKYYRRYVTIKDQGGLRWVGGANNFNPLLGGLGDDVASLTSEPYGASIGYNADFALKCQEACEAKGWARDLCAYLRNYFGSMYLNQYVFGGPFPKPDFALQEHICCSHAKWYQEVAREEGIPFFCIDVSIGPYAGPYKPSPHGVEYIANQCLEAIEWLEKVTGRKFDDEKFINALYNYCRSTALWAKVCTFNKAIPAPLDEKTMYSLYVLIALEKIDREIGDFYAELCDELQERVEKGIAAVAHERFRIITDTQPPWGFLKIFRTMEDYGVVSVGSEYTFGLMGTWDVLEDYTLAPPVTPQERGITFRSREEAVRFMVEWNLKCLQMQHFYEAEIKTNIIAGIVRDWKADGVILHYNRGCEGLTLQIAEVKWGLSQRGIPTIGYEGNCADDREFDPVRVEAQIAAFFESQGLRRIK